MVHESALANEIRVREWLALMRNNWGDFSRYRWGLGEGKYATVLAASVHGMPLFGKAHIEDKSASSMVQTPDNYKVGRLKTVQ